MLGPACGASLVAQTRQGFIQYGQRPAPVEYFLRGLIRNGLVRVALLGLSLIQRNEGLAPAALGGGLAIIFIGEKTIEKLSVEMNGTARLPAACPRASLF